MPPIVVAERWDGLGARLNALLNANSIANALGLEFKFIWPAGAAHQVFDPTEILDDEFVREHRIEPSGMLGRAELADPLRLNLSAARKLVSQSEIHNALIRFTGFLDVPRFQDESEAQASARFRQAFLRTGWSKPVRKTLAATQEYAARPPYAALHIRAGDIVLGKWRQFVPADKYVPSPLLELCIARLLERKLDVIVISDNSSLVEYLQRKFPSLLQPSDVVPGYAVLTPMQQALAGIFTLSGATETWGPKASSFSNLAACLSDTQVRNAAAVVDDKAASSYLRRAFAEPRVSEDTSRPIGAILARDICWYLDVFGDLLTTDEYHRLAEDAARADPEYCAAINRVVISRTQLGQPIDDLVSTSLQLAEESRSTHRDPLFEALSAALSSTALRSAKEATPLPPWFDDTFEQLGRLDPWQIHASEVMQNISAQKAMAEAISSLPSQPPTGLGRQTNHTHTNVLGWRAHGISAVSVLFPQTLRLAETVTETISSILAGRHDELVELPRREVAFYVDGVSKSPTGLYLAEGWAFDRFVPLERLLIGFGWPMPSSVTTTWLPRTDMDAAMSLEGASNCGFLAQLPASTETAETLSGKIRFFRTNNGPRSAPRQGYRSRLRMALQAIRRRALNWAHTALGKGTRGSGFGSRCTRFGRRTR